MFDAVCVRAKRQKLLFISSNDLSVNRLFGMFHSNTADHNKQSNMAKIDGTIQVVFATTALGMGVA